MLYVARHFCLSRHLGSNLWWQHLVKCVVLHVARHFPFSRNLTSNTWWQYLVKCAIPLGLEPYAKHIVALFSPTRCFAYCSTHTHLYKHTYHLSRPLLYVEVKNSLERGVRPSVRLGREVSRFGELFACQCVRFCGFPIPPLPPPLAPSHKRTRILFTISSTILGSIA